MANGELSAPVRDVRDWPILPPLTKKYTPRGKLVCCQVIRGPNEPVDPGQGLFLPDSVKAYKSGLRCKTPIMLAVACGPDCTHIKPGDLFLLVPGVTVQQVWFDGDETIICHEDGTFGVIDKAYERGLRDAHKTGG